MGQYFKGRIALAKGQIAEAIPLLQRAIKEAPRLALAHYYLGQAYIKDQKLEQAKLAFTKASELAPNLAEPHLVLAELALRSQAPRPGYCVGSKTFSSSMRRMALPIDSWGRRSWPRVRRQKRWPSCKTATEKAPQDASSYFYLGTAYQKQKQNQEACDAFAKALALDPNLSEARAQQIVFCTGKDQGARVAEELRKALERDPQNMRLHLQMAALYIEQKQFKEAEAVYVKAAALDPKDASPVLALGRFLRAYSAIRQCGQYL